MRDPGACGDGGLPPVVAVPARDEEALLPRLIAGLGRQSVLDRLKAPLDLVVLLNNTTDRSRAVTEAAAAAVPRLRLTMLEASYPDPLAHVGTARREAMDRAAAMAGPHGVILTTDADAVPSERWIEANLEAIAAGADLVGGRIVGDPAEEAALGPAFQARARLHADYARLRDELAALIDPLPHDPWPRHQDHTGGSLAVRAAVYRQVGGIDPLPFREDLAFVSKVRAAGFRLVHPPDVVVTVSARTRGRAKGGMADCLAAWLLAEAAGMPALVEDPAAVEDRLRRRKALRDLVPVLGLDPTRNSTADPTADPGPEVRRIAALIEREAADDPEAPARVPARVAIAALAARIAALRGVPDAA